jgi:p-aminobenzoyl-glutamate transporter AbgT
MPEVKMFSIEYLQTGQNPTAWIWYMLLAVVVLLLIFWWVNRRNDVPLDEPSTIASPARDQIADDLQKIEGIGPKVAGVLNEAGITTFEALAGADAAEIQETLNAAGLQMMNPEGWIEQASLAAKGDWDGLERLQGELKGGRKT